MSDNSWRICSTSWPHNKQSWSNEWLIDWAKVSRLTRMKPWLQYDQHWDDTALHLCPTSPPLAPCYCQHSVQNRTTEIQDTYYASAALHSQPTPAALLVTTTQPIEIPRMRTVSLNAVSPTVLHASGTVYLTSSLATWTSPRTLSKRNSKRFITLTAYCRSTWPPRLRFVILMTDTRRVKRSIITLIIITDTKRSPEWLS